MREKCNFLSSGLKRIAEFGAFALIANIKEIVIFREDFMNLPMAAILDSMNKVDTSNVNNIVACSIWVW